MQIYEMRGNRLLPSEWKETREKKWGFKTHNKCWGSVRAFFGTAIKWKAGKNHVIYINTNSVKHWWKSNSDWREQHGFGGHFSKKRLIELLNTNISAHLLISDFQRIGNVPPKKEEPKKPSNVEVLPIEKEEKTQKPSEEIIEETPLKKEEPVQKPSDIEVPPPVDQEKLRQEEIETLKKDIEKKINAFGFEPDFKIDESIRKVLKTKTAEENEQFLQDHGLTLPSFKEVDSETEKWMQYRWILLQLPSIISEMEKLINILGKFLQTNPQLSTIDISDKKERLEQKRNEIEAFKIKYLKYIPTPLEEKIFSWVANIVIFSSSSSIPSDFEQELGEILEKFKHDLPKEILDLRVIAYFDYILKQDFQKMFIEEAQKFQEAKIKANREHIQDRYERSIKSIDDSFLDLDKRLEIKTKLKACLEAFDRESFSEKYEIILEKYPQFMVALPLKANLDLKIAQALQEIDLQMIFLMILTSVEVISKESITNKAEELIQKCEALKSWKFDPKNHDDNFKNFNTMIAIRDFVEKFGASLSEDILNKLTIPEAVNQEFDKMKQA